MPTTNIRVDHNNSSTLYFSQRFFNSFFPPIKLDQGPLGWKLVPLKISSPLFMQEEDDIRDLRDFWGHSGNLDQHLMIFHWHRFFAISNIWGHPYTTWPVFWEFWPPSWPNVAFLGTPPLRPRDLLAYPPPRVFIRVIILIISLSYKLIPLRKIRVITL